MPVKAWGWGRTSTNSISRRSPGRAPFTSTGPVIGWIAPASIPAMLAAVVDGPSCPSTPSRVSSTTSSPSSASRIGVTSGCQRLWPVLGWSMSRLLRSISTLFMGLSSGVRGAEGAPPLLRLREAGTAVDEREVAGAASPLLLGGGLVHFEGGLVHHHPIVVPRSARGDETARHVLAHPLRLAGERVSPAPAAAGLEAEQVAALEHEAVAQGRQHALLRRVRIQHDSAGPPRAAARDAVGRHYGILHAGGQLRALGQHPHVAHHSGPAAMQPGPTRVRPHRVALHPQGEIALHVLDRVVLLRDVVDDVDPVGEGPRPEPHPQTFNAQDRPLP